MSSFNPTSPPPSPPSPPTRRSSASDSLDQFLLKRMQTTALRRWTCPGPNTASDTKEPSDETMIIDDRLYGGGRKLEDEIGHSDPTSNGASGRSRIHGVTTTGDNSTSTGLRVCNHRRLGFIRPHNSNLLEAARPSDPRYLHSKNHEDEEEENEEQKRLEQQGRGRKGAAVPPISNVILFSSVREPVSIVRQPQQQQQQQQQPKRNFLRAPRQYATQAASSSPSARPNVTAGHHIAAARMFPNHVRLCKTNDGCLVVKTTGLKQQHGLGGGLASFVSSMKHHHHHPPPPSSSRRNNNTTAAAANGNGYTDKTRGGFAERQQQRHHHHQTLPATRTTERVTVTPGAA